MFDQYLWEDNFLATLFDLLYTRGQERVERYSLEVLEAAEDEFLLSDSPVSLWDSRADRAGFHQGVGWGTADSVFMPLGPRHVVGLSRTSRNRKIDARMVETINAVQIRGTIREAYLRPGSGLDEIITRHLAPADCIWGSQTDVCIGPIPRSHIHTYAGAMSDEDVTIVPESDRPDPREAREELFAFMASASDEMAAEYERVHRRAGEDPGTAGDQGEENWADLLRDWLPNGYHVETKGRILGLTGTSPQVDVIVLSPAYPPALLTKKLYLAAGVVAAFECKLTLSRAGIRSAVENATAIRKVAEVRTGSPYRELHSPIFFGLLAHSHVWKAPRSAPAQNVEAILIEADREFVDHPRQMLDFVCVADLGTWLAMKVPYLGPSLIGEHWTMSRDRSGFPEEGCCTTSYMGPNLESSQPMPRPLGAMFVSVQVIPQLNVLAFK